MNEHPILFSGPMVRAILEGRKTQTRRVLSYQPEEHTSVFGPEMFYPTVIDRNGEEQPGEETFGVYGDDWSLKCHYGKPGDYLWVRETWATSPFTSLGIKPSWIDLRDSTIIYRADIPEDDSRQSHYYWRPSIHMPRKFSRLTLEIVNVRVERLQDISRDDAKAEGVSNIFHNSPEHFERGVLNPYVANFSILWDEINASRGFGWESRPLVWVIEFKRAA